MLTKGALQVTSSNQNIYPWKACKLEGLTRPNITRLAFLILDEQSQCLFILVTGFPNFVPIFWRLVR